MEPGHDGPGREEGGAAPPPPPGARWQGGHYLDPDRPKGGGPRTGPLPLHPMSLADILDGAFNLFKAELRTIVLVAAAFIVPIQVVSAFLQRDFLDGTGVVSILSDPSVTLSDPAAGSVGQSWAALLSLAAALLVLPFVAGAISRVVSAAYLGERMSAGDALRAVAGRWWVFVVAWFLVHVLEAIGTLLCVVPGLLAMALFVPVAPIIAVEGLGPVKAMRRSARLVRPRLFPVLGVALLAGLLASVLGSVLSTVPSIAAFAVGLRWGWILLAAGGILNGLISTTLVAIVATLVYYDLRIRREGLDLQIMAADLARGDPRR